MSRRPQKGNNSVTNKQDPIVPEQKITGCLDKCDAEGVFGWVMDENNPSLPVELNIFIDGELITQTVANIFRQDLLDSGLGDGNHAFNSLVPEKFFDDSTHAIEIRTVLTNAVLDGVKTFILPSSAPESTLITTDGEVTDQQEVINPIKSCFDAADAEGIRGWVIDENNPHEPLELSIYIDDELIAQIVADVFRQDLLDTGVGDGRCAFNYAMPKRFFDNVEHKIEIKNTLNEDLLNGCPKSFSLPPKFQGVLDRCDEKGIRGWVINEYDPNKFVELDIFIDGELSIQTTANLLRQDLLNAGSVIRQCAFYVPIPNQFADGVDHEVEIREKQTAWMLTHPKPIFNVLTKIQWDGFVTKHAVGWCVYGNQGESIINLSVADQRIGSFIANQNRPDVQNTFHLQTDKLGFHKNIGGILQFLALSEKNHTFNLSLESDSSIAINVEIKVSDALTFTPMSLVIERREDLFSQYASQIRIVGSDILEVIFQKRAGEFVAENYSLSMYQMDNNSILKLIAFQSVESSANLAKISGKLFDIQKPILIAVTSKKDNQFIFTDCVPYPALFHHDNGLMIELHSLFVNGQAPLLVNRRLQKHWLDSEVRLTNPGVFPNSISSFVPNKTKTAVIFYSRDIDAISNVFLLPSWSHLAESAYSMEFDSDRIKLKSVPSIDNFDNIEEVMSADSFSAIPQTYLLFWDITSTIRPDYWSIIHTYCSSAENYKVITGNSIIYDGLSTPYYVGHKPLTGFMGKELELLPLSSALFQRDTVTNLSNVTEKFKHLFPENMIAQLEENDLFHLRLPIDVRRQLPILEGERIALASQGDFRTNLLDSYDPIAVSEKHLQLSSTLDGFSVIINFRNAAESTKQAITALRMQNYAGNIELILVNNDSHTSAVNEIMLHATSLFGASFVKLIDYPLPFNHSAQTDLAVEAASYPLLLMLSNDAFLLSPTCLERAANILQNPHVGTCGFRIIRQTNNFSFRVESVGLRLAMGKLCTLGGQLLQRNIPLDRDVGHVMHVAGNTFAAAAIRTEVFNKVGGMSKEKFPATYNDVEFCLRTSNYGLIHVVDGLSVIQHSGRGTREPDLDFPTEPAILKSVFNIDELANGYTLYDFGGLRVF